MTIYAHTNPLSPPQAAHVLDGLIYAQVCKHVDFSGLLELQERVAIELARLRAVTDEQMLDLARATIARALFAVADGYRHAEPADDSALQTRYLNAICRAVDSGCAEAQ